MIEVSSAVLALATAGVSAMITMIATPVLTALARRTGLVAKPRQDRWHKAPTPLAGGAMVLALLATVVAFGPRGPETFVLLGGMVCAYAVGLLDDFRHVAPTTKVVGQVLVAVLLVFGGIHVEIIDVPVAAFLVTVLWVVGLMNALNLMDNMDGLAAGVTAIAASALTIASLSGDADDSLVALTGAATTGAALAFLVFNFSPARVFMGDGGSLVLGFILAATSLLHTGTTAANVGLALLAPLAVVALPIFDTLLVTMSRRIAGRPISRGGRDHASHRLAMFGLSDRATVLVLYAVSAVFAALGVGFAAVGAFGIPLLALATVGLVLFGAFLFEVDVYRQDRRERMRAASDPIARSLLVYGRFGAEIAIDVVLLTVAYHAAYMIRFEGQPEAVWRDLFVSSLPVIVGGQLGGLMITGAYRTLWRYLSVRDAVTIVRGITLGSGAAIVAAIFVFRFENFSRVVFVLDWLMAVAVIVAARVSLLWLRDWVTGRVRTGERRVLIVGAGDDGAMALRLLEHSRSPVYQVVGFVDDDPGKRYRRLAGVPVVGTTADLRAVIHRSATDLVVVALGSADERRPAIAETCRQEEIECREFWATGTIIESP